MNKRKNAAVKLTPDERAKYRTLGDRQFKEICLEVGCSKTMVEYVLRGYTGSTSDLAQAIIQQANTYINPEHQ